MANAIYGKGRQAFGNADIDWLDDNICVQLVDTAAYTVLIDSHEFLSDIPSGARIGAPVSLSSKTNLLGVMDAANLSVTGLTSAPSIEALVVFKNTGNPATSRLIEYIDTATGLPVASGAPQVDVTWAAEGIFKL
jgi:hypothetical protein